MSNTGAKFTSTAGALLLLATLDVISVGSPFVDSVDDLPALVVERFEGGPRTAVLNPITFKNLEDIWFGDVNRSDNGSCWSNQIGKLCAWKEQ